MSIAERGFSLAETLIAMAIGSVLLLGAARFLPALQSMVLQQARQQALENELWQRLYTVAKHLQRAGYCQGRCSGQALLIAEGGACVIMRWDGDGNGVWQLTPEANSDVTGFRLRESALETRRGVTDCRGKGWEKMTDPQVIEVTQFRVTRYNTPGFSPELAIMLTVQTTLAPRLTARAQYRVTGYNL